MFDKGFFGVVVELKIILIVPVELDEGVCRLFVRYLFLLDLLVSRSARRMDIGDAFRCYRYSSLILCCY